MIYIYMYNKHNKANLVLIYIYLFNKGTMYIHIYIYRYIYPYIIYGGWMGDPEFGIQYKNLCLFVIR